MAAASAAPRIFVSYARSDGKEIAAELRRRLQDEHGFPLWQDLADMEGGRDWWQQITEAIDHVEFLVLVMTPAALGSEYVRREWRYARQQGRCVIPVIGAEGIDFTVLSGWMRRSHFVDPTSPSSGAVSSARSRGRARPRVRRSWSRTCPTFSSAGRANSSSWSLRCSTRTARSRSRSPRRCAAPAATARPRSPARSVTTKRIQSAFDDGILWVTLGEQPGDIQGHVVDLIEVLTGERPGFSTLDAATTRLAEALGERRMLIVIDDVWNAAHTRPFLQGGPYCARLITTRNSDALPTNARRIDVDAMKGSEANELIRYDLPDGEDDVIKRLAARLGEWPLLLKLVNGALRRRVDEMNQSLSDALTWVSIALDRRGLAAFDAREAEDRSQAVAKTLGVSLELLNEDDRARFAELATFPEDVDVPLNTVAALWGCTAGLDDFDTEDLCGRFFGLSLLLRLDLATRRTRLHDVIRGYLQAEQKERLLTFHADMVGAYRAQSPEGWYAGPDDGYFFQYLPYHLGKAERIEELRELLFDYRWLRAKLKAVGLAGVIQDFELLRTDEQTRRMAAGLRMSAHALASDPRQLAGQLLGRFVADDGPEIATLLTEAREGADRPAFLPLRPTLTPPGTVLIRILAGHGGRIRAAAALPERGQALSGADDGTLRLWDLEGGQEVRRFTGHLG